MAYGDDITEGIPYALSNPVNNQTYALTGVAYDLSIAGQPFFLETSDETPYRRVTAQYRKQQLDTTREPGEQTLTGWWIRSQSTFHLGQGVKFFEPAQDESLRFQYTYSKGCDVWSKGQVTLLNDSVSGYATIGTIRTNNRPNQYARSIRWKISTTNYDGILLSDNYLIKKIDSSGTVTAFQTYTSSTPIFSMCDDGIYAYWVINNASTGFVEVLKKLLSDDSTVPATSMFTSASIVATNAVIEFTKERLVMAVNNSVYEFATTASLFPTAVYSHPNTGYIYTSITSSGTTIYLSGYSGIQSTIQKFVLVTSGATAGSMPSLTSAITAAELPVGEVVYKIYYYLGYMAIGTSLGVRIAAVSDTTDGAISYGPLIVETAQPVYDFSARDKFLWCATGVDGSPGVIRINLGQEVTSLVFAYAYDLYYPTVTLHATTACAFIGNLDRLSYISTNDGSTNGAVYSESATVKIAQGELRTGYIRYNTIEHKLFKNITPRFNTVDGGITIYSVQDGNIEYNIGTYPQNSYVDTLGIPYPTGAEEFLGFKFVFSRSDTDSTLGPTFTGYQVNSLPSIPRQRLIQYPIMMYDYEMDKFNNPSGYEGSAYDRMGALESIEDIGDTIRVQDFRTNETYIGLIEEMDFTNKTPTDKRFSGYGGVLLVTIRKV
jgi:hypothetical protein